MAEQAAYLGTSYKYPLQPGAGGRPVFVSGEENIRQSINSILSTPIGTRFYLEEYGSNVHRLTFTPQDEVLKSLLRFHIPDAMGKWEKRIKVTEVQFKAFTESEVENVIFYRILASNEIDSFIFPFYREIIF